jgi:hypothetical protein
MDKLTISNLEMIKIIANKNNLIISIELKNLNI